jgi:hypothetical protein
LNDVVKRSANSRLFKTPGVTATLIIFECRGDGHPAAYRREVTKDLPLALVTMSSSPQQLLDPPDQGLPPPAGKPANLDKQQIHEIQTCNETSRPYFLTFAGNFRDKIRQELLKVHDPRKEVYIFKRQDFEKHLDGKYEDMLSKSKFALTPRGDNKFSYRFTEVLSAGAIPVVHADGLVLPFRRELVDWSECAVVLPQFTANRTLDFLLNITDAQRCKMRQRCYEIYDKYMKTDEGTIAGIIEGLELVAESRGKSWGAKAKVDIGSHIDQQLGLEEGTYKGKSRSRSRIWIHHHHHHRQTNKAHTSS